MVSEAIGVRCLFDEYSDDLCLAQQVTARGDTELILQY